LSVIFHTPMESSFISLLFTKHTGEYSFICQLFSILT
jgi:hypothetical protein